MTTTTQPQMGLLTVQDVIAAHRAAEQYMRRLLFVALRVNEVQYNSAENIVELAHNTTPYLLFAKSITLLANKPENAFDFDAFMAKNSDLMPLFDGFMLYATPVRHRLAQGNDEQNRADAYKTAYHISKSLVTEIERILQAEFAHSAFETPKNWGARTIATAETPEQIIARLALQQIVGGTLTLSEVHAKLSKTKYAI
jgi:hypothetical protein